MIHGSLFNGVSIKLTKKLGRNRLYLELLNKGIDKETIADTLNTLYVDNPEMELATQCARKKWGTLKGIEEEKKNDGWFNTYKEEDSSDIIYQSLRTLSESTDIEHKFPQPSLDQD